MSERGGGSRGQDGSGWGEEEPPIEGVESDGVKPVARSVLWRVVNTRGGCLERAEPSGGAAYRQRQRQQWINFVSS